MIYDLEFGDEGTDVRRLQEHLNSVSAAGLSPDGGFGTLTRTALRNYQHGIGVPQSGKVDEATFNALASRGLVLLGPPAAGSSASLSWPAEPVDLAQPTVARTEAVFSAFEFRHSPTPTDPEHIEILNDWVAQNIVRLHIPQLDKGLFAAGRHYARREQGTISCHRLAAPSFLKLFQLWEKAGLIDRVLTCAGAFNARLKRGSTSPKRMNLSNHSWGTAIDINARENPLGTVPVGLGARGCVRELVGIANELGFYWGGHFASRPDGMHFELAAIK